MLSQDDPVSPCPPNFFSHRISAIPMTRLDWGWEAHALRSYATGNRQSYDENRGKKNQQNRGRLLQNLGKIVVITVIQCF